MLIIIEWLFGAACIFSSFMYFTCGEYLIGSWLLLFGTALIPPIYKFILPKIFVKFSRPKFLIFSLIIFSLLFANFLRPLFDKDKLLNLFKRYAEHKILCAKALNLSQNQFENNKNSNCDALIKTQKECFLARNKAKSYLIEDKKSPEVPAIYKLIIIPIIENAPDKFKNYEKEMARTKLKCIILN